MFWLERCNMDHHPLIFLPGLGVLWQNLLHSCQIQHPFKLRQTSLRKDEYIVLVFCVCILRFLTHFTSNKNCVCLFLHFFRSERFVKWSHLEFSLCRTLLFLYMLVKKRKRSGHNTGSTEVSEVVYHMNVKNSCDCKWTQLRK